MRQDEYILCAAVWFDDGIDHKEWCLNGKPGYVICGRRHHNCFSTAYYIDPERKYIKHEKEQGFITNKDRFVDRIEASEIAFLAGQIRERTKHPQGLFSEDLY